MARELPDGTRPEEGAPPHDSFAWDGPGDVGRASSGGFLLDALRRRPVGHAVLNVLVAVLFVSGAGMFAYPFFTDVYTEQVIQDRLQDEFVAMEVQTFDEWEDSVRGQSGAALTKIVIPDIGVETLVVEGTSPAALRAGAGHYPNTPLPGQSGNVAIAGHRTTYGKPFNRVDELAVGSVIWLITPVGDHRYVVTDQPASDRCRTVQSPDNPDLAACITDPKDWKVIAPTSTASLTLTSCHPKGSASERIIIRAELAETLPPGTWESQRTA
ncbi:MAG: class E sortase [Actinobacteria bacterium]|nr:class E sortase [Actinomycetota bacterium]